MIFAIARWVCLACTYTLSSYTKVCCSFITDLVVHCNLSNRYLSCIPHLGQFNLVIFMCIATTLHVDVSPLINLEMNILVINLRSFLVDFKAY